MAWKFTQILMFLLRAFSLNQFRKATLMTAS